MKTKIKNKNGFSLPELITVVVIIAVLGAIALGVVNNINKQAKTNAGKANAATLSRMITQILAAGGTVGPAGMNTYTIDTENSTTAIQKLNDGFTFGGMNFKMQPPITNVPNAFGPAYESYDVTPGGLFTYPAVGNTNPTP